MQLRSSHAHEEGAGREWSIATTGFSGTNGQLRALHAVRVETTTGADGGAVHRPVRGSDHTIDADLVLLALGFAGPEESPLLRELGVHRERGVVATSGGHRTNVDGVFVAGDARRGASLLVWAIREGRDAASEIDAYLKPR
jgi:glutamate synthase (NADPH/NADH) small chain